MEKRLILLNKLIRRGVRNMPVYPRRKRKGGVQWRERIINVGKVKHKFRLTFRFIIM